MNNDPCMNQELAYNIISLQNQVKELKDKCQNQQKIIKDLKEKAITKELLDTLYPTNLAFKNINFNKKGALLDNEKSVQYGPYKKYFNYLEEKCTENQKYRHQLEIKKKYYKEGSYYRSLIDKELSKLDSTACDKLTEYKEKMEIN